jgi:hypothetical protein
MEYTYNEKFELVLYFSRRVAPKPSEPIFEEVQKVNPHSDMDGVLDIYSELKNKYVEDMKKYEKIKSDSIVEDYIRIPEDENLIATVKEFEKNNFFVEWSKASKRLIDNALVQMSK